MDSQVGDFRLYIMKRNIRKILDTDYAIFSNYVQVNFIMDT